MIAATVVIVLNIKPIIETINIISSSGGPMGFGLLTLPIQFSMHIFLVSGILALTKKGNPKAILKVNILGIIWIVFLIIYLSNIN